MRRSQYRRATSWFSGRRRIVAAVATLVAFGGIVTVTQVSDASTRRSTNRALAACNRLEAPKASKLSTKTKRGTYTTNNGRVTQHPDDGAGAVPTAAEMRQRCRAMVMQQARNGGGASSSPNTGGARTNGVTGGANAPGAALGVLANNCDDSRLEPHDGFQRGDRCISTEFGEVGAAANNPSLLIAEAPENVGVNQAFTLRVSTKNLIRDRFLAAGQGGYYVESSILQDGLVRGHFHTACRMLESTSEAPGDPEAVPEFFVATEDSNGGRDADFVNIQVAGMPREGTAQCAVWAGDGSHRIPMMERANQTPAFDTTRIQVGGGNNDNNGDNDNNNNGGDNNNDGNNNDGNDNNNGGQAEVRTINCPTVADKLQNIPAGAQAEVMRNLALLETQLKESNARLAGSAGEGGANFVQNAVVGPLEGKRRSTLDRIRLSIERNGGQAPADLDKLADCSA